MEYIFSIIAIKHSAWLLLGIFLLVVDLIAGTFIFLWFGISAILTGAIVYLHPAIDITWQVGFWLLFAVSSALCWFALNSKRKSKAEKGHIKELLIGELATVTSYNSVTSEGILRVCSTKLDKDEWLFVSEDRVSEGDYVKVTGVSKGGVIKAVFHGN